MRRHRQILDFFAVFSATVVITCHVGCSTVQRGSVTQTVAANTAGSAVLAVNADANPETNAPSATDPLVSAEPVDTVDDSANPALSDSTSGSESSPSAPPKDSANSTEANAHVVDVLAERADDDTWSFVVAVQHYEKGWSDYTDGWDIVLPDGTVVLKNPNDKFTRRMFHPHKRYKILQRGQVGLTIPAEVNEVLVRAHDSKYGYGGREIRVRLDEESGDGFRVVRPKG